MRQSQLTGRARLRGLLIDTSEARQTIDHERHRFDELRGDSRPVVSSPQLFPTPPALARRVASIAISGKAGALRVLEPSAGTGNLINAMAGDGLSFVAVEISHELCDHLSRHTSADVRCKDFLECNGDLGAFDLVVMNPPFAGDGGIKHIEHARQFLKPGGRLVAIFANGPRQRAKLIPEADDWIDLPRGSFKESGTDVSAAIVIYNG